MPNVMFIAVDEGYPDTMVVKLTDAQVTELTNRHWELGVEDEDWEDWSDVIFGGDEMIDLPATVDHTCVVFVY
jgi:hypothetical protein